MKIQILAAIFCLMVMPCCNAFGAAKDYQIIKVKKLTGDGGRVDWSPDGQAIVFDRKGKDGLYDIWMMKPDGTSQTNLTKEHPEGKPRGRPLNYNFPV